MTATAIADVESIGRDLNAIIASWISVVRVCFFTLTGYAGAEPTFIYVSVPKWWHCYYNEAMPIQNLHHNIVCFIVMVGDFLILLELMYRHSVIWMDLW